MRLKNLPRDKSTNMNIINNNNRTTLSWNRYKCYDKAAVHTGLHLAIAVLICNNFTKKIIVKKRFKYKPVYK